MSGSRRRVRRRPARRRPSAPVPITRRGAILLVALFVLAIATVLPLRQHAQQRARIEQLEAKRTALVRENTRLERERARLRDPAHVEQLARRDLQMVRPGEEAWVLSGTPPTTAPAAAAKPATSDDRPWYKRAWDWLTG